jgi:tRNA(Arg) A34 adenosine deaminase TadA
MNDLLVEKFPVWFRKELANIGTVYKTEFDRMTYVIGLSRRNVTEETGGPFGAAIFERESGELVSIGVNLVIHSNCSHAHAEMVAIAMAQQHLQNYNLADIEGHEYELVTSCEPCAMCFGAIPWSGVTRVVSGAEDADARKIGFDEGPKPHSWAEALEERNIEVKAGYCREDAADVLEFYALSGGEIYNGV